MKKIQLLTLVILCILCGTQTMATGPKQKSFSYNDSWGKAGFNLVSSNTGAVNVIYSVTEFQITDEVINGKTMQTIQLPGHFLPNNAGAPNLPGSGRYIAIPENASPQIRIINIRTESIQGVEMAPAPRIPFENEDGLEYFKDPAIYNSNNFYPAQPVIMSNVTELRGVDAVMLGVTPFRYNPVTKELIVVRDISIEITFKGGSGVFGDDRLRSRWFDPILRDALLNESSLPEAAYTFAPQDSTQDFEYIIIVPNSAPFESWADSLKNWRTLQGIRTGVFTLADVGGSTTTAIENFINNAYNTWTIPPSAVLLLGDYNTNAAQGILSPIYNSYCVSDNIYADVNNDHLPDIAFARMTANTELQLSIMIGKVLSYERTPPTSQDFYAHPITAMGWQTERWFQLCSEVVNGFFQYGLGKSPVRENAIYSGTPGGAWSTATNTATVVNYFGPSGLNYIPTTTAHLTDWGSNATRVNAKINNGAFILQHRDHGFEGGWGEPDYSTPDLSGLNNTDLTFVFSVNCLTGKFNHTTETFAEAFHRYPQRALGILAATEVSYSFVNDAFVWGLYDYMWPSFMPAYGTAGQVKLLPAFGNVAGKYFLQQSSWPYNTSNKEVTYHLFHHNGDAFSVVYSEVPQNLLVIHNPVQLAGVTTFPIQADSNALICLTVNGEIIGIGNGTGGLINITIPAQLPGNNIIVTVTKQNYYRYSQPVQVIPPSGPYILYNSYTLNDAGGNGNGQADFGESVAMSLNMKNVGIANANNVTVKIGTADPYVTITDSVELYGTLQAGSDLMISNAFAFTIADSIQDGHKVKFDISASDSAVTWASFNYVTLNAPVLNIVSVTVSDPLGNNNNRIDPGESFTLVATIANSGHAEALNGSLVALTAHPKATVVPGVQVPDTLSPTSNYIVTTNATVDTGIAFGTNIDFILALQSGKYSSEKVFFIPVGQVDENFETGNLLKYTWTGGGNAPWTVTTSLPQEGTYCARSGIIGNSASSTLQISVTVTANDSISFYRKVSSEAGYDFLQFYIDNNKLGQWSGTQSWQKVSFAVTAGAHVFKWVYSKDNYAIGGSDAAWIDMIKFPPMILQGTPLSVNTVAVSDELCQGSDTRLYAIAGGGNGNYSYIWTPAAGLSSTSVYNPIASPDTTTVYSIAVTDGQNLATKFHTITVHPSPEIQLGPSDTALCADQVLTLNAGIPNGASWLWTPGNQATSVVVIDSTGIGFGSRTFTVYAEDIHGCSDLESIMVTFVNCAGLEEIAANEGITVYPNPGSGIFTLEVNLEGRRFDGLQLYDIQGAKVYSQALDLTSGPATTTIDVSHLDAGLYFIQLSGPGQTIVKKVLISRH